MPTRVYGFTTPGNYTYGSDVEVAGSQAQLDSLETPTVYTEDFNDAAGLTFGADVEISGGAQAQLKLSDDPGQVNTEDFANDTDFTYNASNTEFSGGQIQQIQKAYRPSYVEGTFFADYDSSIDGDYGDGVLTGTASGGAAIVGNKLDCTGGTAKYVDYDANLNGDSQQTGCIRFKITPSYSGAPAALRGIFVIAEAHNITSNNIGVYHTGTALHFWMKDGSDVVIFDIDGVWSPTASQTYEFEINYDIAAGESRLFVDGVLLASDLVSTGVRDSDIGLLRIGSNANATWVSDYLFEDLIVFDTVQHTSNYTPAAYGGAYQPTFYAGFGEDVNGDWGDGVLTGTAVGGATVAAGKLDLKYSDLRYVSFPSTDNITWTSQGCVRFKYTPNYTGWPPASVTMFSAKVDNASLNNLINIYHAAGNGKLIIAVLNSAGGYIVDYQAPEWNPTTGVEYEIELNFDVVPGATRIFMDGTQYGATQVGTGTRTNTITEFVVGTSRQETAFSNCEIADLIIFDHVQHTSNYTPDWTGILPYEYDGDVITLPAMAYSGPGAVQELTDFDSTEAGSPRWILDDQYWSGAAWVASAGTYAQANTEADVITNILTFPHNGTSLTAKIVFDNNIGGQGAVSNVDIECTTQAYSAANPAFDIDTAIVATDTTGGVAAWNSFAHTVAEVGGDSVTFTLSDDNGVTYKYWDGAAWSVSAGFPQTNGGTLVATNFSTFPTVAAGLKVRIYLHSNDGTTTPNISDLVINYDDTIYSVLNPTITPAATLGSDGLISFAASVTEAGSDTITFTIDVDGTEWYWTGAAWAGTGSFANSNTAADINTNAAALDLSVGAAIRFVAYIHSNDGSTYPSIQDITFEYDFYNAPDVMPTPVVISGFLKDTLSQPIVGATVEIRPSRSFVPLNTDSLVIREWSSYTTDATGYYEFSVTPSISVDGDPVTYDFKFTVGTAIVEVLNKTAPVAPDVDFGDL